MNKRILSKALNIASLLQGQKQRISAIVADKKGNILSIGTNSYSKSHPLMAKYSRNVNKKKIYLHAEIDALLKIPYGKIPHSIYIARAGENNEPRLAKPCKICQQAIKDVNIKNIYYT